MTNTISLIPLRKLTMGLIPDLAVAAILYVWEHDYKKVVYAFGRMVIQLMMIGYLLSYIFGSDSTGLALMALTVMLLAASWISIRTANHDLHEWYLIVFTPVDYQDYRNVAVKLVDHFLLIALEATAPLIFFRQS